MDEHNDKIIKQIRSEVNDLMMQDFCVGDEDAIFEYLELRRMVLTLLGERNGEDDE